MSLRPRPPKGAPVAEARVAALRLGGLQRLGWVPPPEPDPGGQVATLPAVAADPDAGRPAGVLPSPLRGGVWEPGRRGVLALAFVAALAAAVTGLVVLRGRPAEIAAPPVLRPGPAASAAPAGQIVVAVAGRVPRPGLVRLPTGSRIDDAVRAAGGVLPGADPGLLNLARVLVDGEQVLVGILPGPANGAAAGGPTAGGGSGGKVDLNVATAAELDALPGIGGVLAQNIVDWRTRHGRFASVDQLREVTGIGESKYASLRDKVRV